MTLKTKPSPPQAAEPCGEPDEGEPRRTDADEDQTKGHQHVGDPVGDQPSGHLLLIRRRPRHRAEEWRGQQQEKAGNQHREHCRRAQVAEHGDQTIDQDPDRSEEQSPRHLPELPPLAEKHAD
jgi:hypothetical protein